MNKRKFSRVLSLYKDGVGFIPCCEAIMSMSKSKTEGCIWIGKLHEEAIQSVLLLLKEAEFRLKYPCENCRPSPNKVIWVKKTDDPTKVKCIECGRDIDAEPREGGLYEPTYRTELADLED